MSLGKLRDEDLMECVEALALAWFALADSLVASGAVKHEDLAVRMKKAANLPSMSDKASAKLMLLTMSEGLKP